MTEFSTKEEQEAVLEGTHRAGQIIESMIEHGYGSDFSTWPSEAFQAMIEATIDGYTTKLRELCAEAPPF